MRDSPRLQGDRLAVVGDREVHALHVEVRKAQRVVHLRQLGALAVPDLWVIRTMEVWWWEVEFRQGARG
jgi:hypothetical protein